MPFPSALRRCGISPISSEHPTWKAGWERPCISSGRNTGYAAAWAALDGGATTLDASVGGLGGCPFSPNATGNIATEDLVWQLEREGVKTGIDLDAVVAVSRWLERELGRRLEGQLYRSARWPA